MEFIGIRLVAPGVNAHHRLVPDDVLRLKVLGEEVGRAVLQNK
jgi:hypothetical protein